MKVEGVIAMLPAHGGQVVKILKSKVSQTAMSFIRTFGETFRKIMK